MTRSEGGVRSAERTAPAPAGAPLALTIDGERVDPRAPQLSALDRGFTLADGLFETMYASAAGIFRLEQHLARLRAGARALGIALPADVGGMVRGAWRMAAPDAAASVRLTVSRGAGTPGVAPAAGARPTVVVAVHALPHFPASTYATGISASVASGRRNERAMSAGLKTLGYVDSVMALAEARAAGDDDALFLDTEGHLSEATSSNLFVCAGGALATPPASCAALPGITRAAVLEIATTLGIAAEERALAPDELFAADEAFLTSSLRAVAPLVRVTAAPSAARPVGDGRVGAVTRRLMAAYAELVARELA